jgi:hypothetical protein
MKKQVLSLAGVGQYFVKSASSHAVWVLFVKSSHRFTLRMDRPCGLDKSCHPEAFLWPKDLAVAVAVDLAVAVDSVSRLT